MAGGWNEAKNAEVIEMAKRTSESIRVLIEVQRRVSGPGSWLSDLERLYLSRFARLVEAASNKLSSMTDRR